MALIPEIAQQALNAGYLSTTAKHQIQAVLSKSCDSEDIDALIILERAITAGVVEEESDKPMVSPVSKRKGTSAANVNLAYQIAAELAAAAALALTMSRNLNDKSLLST
jgi:hypothetical protein